MIIINGVLLYDYCILNTHAIEFVFHLDTNIFKVLVRTQKPYPYIRESCEPLISSNRIPPFLNITTH